MSAASDYRNGHAIVTMQKQRTLVQKQPPHLLTEAQFDALVAHSRWRGGFAFGGNVYDADARWPLGGGRVRYLRVEPFAGIHALYCEFDVGSDMQVTLAPRDDVLASFFLDGCLSGSTVGTGQDDLEFRPCHTMVRMPNRAGGYAIRIPGAQRHRFVQIRFERPRLLEWLRTTGAGLSQRTTRLLGEERPLVLCNAAWSAATGAALRELSAWNSDDAAFAPRFMARSVELMTLLSREFESLLEGARSRPPSRAPGAGRVQAARRLIDASPGEAWSVDALARRLAWNATSLQGAFRRDTGLSVHRYVKAQRLALAQRLLRSTRLPIADVAAECGWSCAGRFAQAFQQHAGVAPAAFRRGDGPA